MTGIRRGALLAAALVSLAAAPYGHASAAAFQAWARAAEIPLSTAEWVPIDSDLAPFAKVVGTARVVALGEPGHGAHQPLEFRNRLFGYLVTHCGFTAIGLETSFTEARAINDFVLGGGGDAAALARRHLTWGFGGYEENVQLIRWMRSYNEHAGSGRKLHFYGIDMSGANDDADFTHAGIAIRSVVQYLARVSPGSQRLRTGITPQLRLMKRLGYRQMAIRHEPALEDVLDSLQAYLLTNAPALRHASSQTDYEWAAHNLVVARQLRDYLRLQPAPEGTSTRIGPMDYLLDDVRENAMATNALWALGEEGARGRLLVFAHDAHVMSAQSRGGMWSAFKKPPVMMGAHLRAHLGAQLLIIGDLAAHNGPGLPAGHPIPGSVEAALERLDVPLFALDLRTARGNAGAAGWLDGLRPIRANFDTQLDVVPALAFDVIVFMNEIGPAKSNSALH